MFSIGEFSRIARVTPRQLRHYEALGLFQPERIDPETGYRFYNALQLPRLNRMSKLYAMNWNRCAASRPVAVRSRNKACFPTM